MKTIALFGGTGGLGSQLAPLLEELYTVITIGSKYVDVTNYDNVKTFFSNNKIDIVINLSGYNYDSFLHKYTDDSYSEVQKQIDINIKGTINVTSCALPQMRERQYGRVILLSSVLADHPVISTSIYSGCKGFVDSFTKTVALENIGKNVTCNSLQLGYFDGGLTYKIPESFREVVKNNIPAKRWGSIRELYNTIDYLIKTPYLTGQNINISGGII
ncbi:FabG Dehydrogenases with different specificities (related to short-chain alcohol dehydrogenases) [uncultured Caudovirales phage]|uniref:FabG Dehydrogenases with different specificities (Related to short-chain alcohol dehydrogenases) n=1 Tax=uncultured Caudovirales phage TaxID=2100421 RepID=A0A6J5PGC5_9CAUD|nr:FabG Dehydrogenases with different specificities (related to short-chain alcohol dehydrogenases) [uncultured Caudovirales phage]CAB4170493.1 FabG Dehydrogenases with different specificities (related to short-chain alcohol dehydrogenases) [uncultured Caudovirales phage]CAB4198591.1 FabG Dehydrogenases with different specificities (related to short-chain alcohol dehydrogenases) [uncultured Caudovirales phage]